MAMARDLLMSATTRLTLEEFLQLPDEPGKRFELHRGELVVEPSPALRHNAICFRIARHLHDFISASAQILCSDRMLLLLQVND